MELSLHSQLLPKLPVCVNIFASNDKYFFFTLEIIGHILGVEKRDTQTP